MPVPRGAVLTWLMDVHDSVQTQMGRGWEGPARHGRALSIAKGVQQTTQPSKEPAMKTWIRFN